MKSAWLFILSKCNRLLGCYNINRFLLLQSLPKHSVGAEIGVWQGYFSEKLYKYTRPKSLYLIDPWKFCGHFPDRWYGGTWAKNQEDMDNIFEGVAKKFIHNDDITIMRKPSAEGLADIADHSLDWVYIDGDHSYEAVLEDLKRSDQKVSPTGLITGDDFLWRRVEKYPVRRAVEMFMKAHPTYMLQTYGDQFIIRKS